LLELQEIVRDMWEGEKALPRVHGNGFVQLDLDDRTRLHVWGDHRIPRQSVASPIHNHVFGFESRVFVGTLLNLRFRLDEGGTHVVHEARPPREGEGDRTLLAPIDGPNRVRPRIGAIEVVRAGDIGQTYSMRPFDFHVSLAYELAVSVIWKDGDTLAQNPTGHRPQVLVRKGQRADNDFDRHGYDPELLWQIIGDALYTA
jgi:hypothetical protein